MAFTTNKKRFLSWAAVQKTCRPDWYITKFYTVVRSPQKQAVAPVYTVKSGVTLNKKAV